jgi:hypothetical protein
VTDRFPKRDKTLASALASTLASNSSDPALPPPDTKRWVARRKAVIVEAVRSGVIDLEEVCRRYNLSVEEFQAWKRAIERYGVPGLRVTRLQIYRDTDAAAPKSGRRSGQGNGRNHDR